MLEGNSLNFFLFNFFLMLNIYFYILIIYVLSKLFLCVLYKGQVLISCLLQLSSFSDQLLKLFLHVECSFT